MISASQRVIGRSLRLILFGLLCSAVAHSAVAQRLRIVTEAWPPLVESKNGEPAGILWEMAREVLQNMGYEPELEFVPWSRALRMVEMGERDAILGIGFTPERLEKYVFPTEHLLLSETVVFTLQDSNLNYTGVKSLAGLQVGLQAGYAYSTELREFSNFERFNVPTIESGLLMLKRGRIDALLANRYVAWSEARRLGIEHAFAASETAVSGGPVFLAFRKTLPLTFIEQFSREMAAYKQVWGIAENGFPSTR